MSGVEIHEKNFSEFFETPFVCYPPDSPFVSVFKDDLKRFLNPSNPLFQHFGEYTYFTALVDGKLMGRIVAHIHHASNQKHELNRGYFGYFDCADDLEVAKALLTRAESWAREKGCSEIAGNFNLTAMQQIGVVTEGFENSPFTDQVWCPPHLAKLLSACGYESFFPMTTFEVNLKQFDPETILNDRIRDALKHFEFKKVTGKNFKQLMHDTCDVLNDGFMFNPMFVPLTHEEFWFQAKDMMLIIDDRLPQLAYEHGKAVGALVCIPDLNPFLKKTASRLKLSTIFHFLNFKRNRKRAVIIFYSVVRDQHGKGINGALLYRAIRAMKDAGYEELGLTWIADVNGASIRQAEKLSAKPLHRLHLFKKSLASGRPG